MKPRYAIYFAPANRSPWWDFGAHWLGRDESTDTTLPQPRVAGISAEALQQATIYPRRYGFHATLKAPFALTESVDLELLKIRMHALAATLSPVSLGPMEAIRMGDFVALAPRHPPPNLAALEAACVTTLDDMREPLSSLDLARRLSPQLDARALDLLNQYGYPHVLERFQLHMTLTSPVNDVLATKVIQAVSDTVDQLNARCPMVLDRLCVFKEPGSGQAFRRLFDVALSP